jgi:hypothetical protein
VLAAAVVAFAGCGPGRTVEESVGTHSIEGQLSSGRINGVTCDWITDAQGERYAVTWPDGYQSAGDPVRVTGPEGKVVATRGAILRLRGPLGAIGESICAPNIFLATELTVVAPSASD